MEQFTCTRLRVRIAEAATWKFPLCPAPGEPLAWDALVAQFKWLRDLAACLQDPIYHAEGDVLTHTRMVADRLVASSAWQSLPDEERSIVFAAALLHDVAKPRCTAVEADGRISARGHARLGARMARHIFWQSQVFLAAPVPLYCREAIVSLVRLHGVPVYLVDEADPLRTVIRAAQSVRCDRLALVAEADVCGRRCADQHELIERVTLFRSYAHEQRCLEGPRPFPSDHSRFVYFQKAYGDPNYHAYDDTRCEVTLMAGLPGAGKDTYIQHHLQGRPVISLDALRSNLDIAPEDEQGPVIDAALEQARIYLRARQSFIWNATNITRRMRARLITLFAAYGAHIHIVYVEASFPTLLQRNAARARPVPEAVIRTLADRLDVPDLTEAHQVDWVTGPL
jgi:putative nucleotidyltransferase with HDIG domain